MKQINEREYISVQNFWYNDLQNHPKKKPFFKALFKSKGYTYYGSKKLIEKAQWPLKQIKKKRSLRELDPNLIKMDAHSLYVPLYTDEKIEPKKYQPQIQTPATSQL